MRHVSRGGVPIAPGNLTCQRTMYEPTSDADAGLTIPGYEGFRRIGSGGFSTVYRARQASLGREVAIKVLHSAFTSDSDRRTFERECHAMGLLSRHPNIVTVYSEAFTVDGRPGIVMELYRGNYRDRLDESGPLPVDEVLTVGVKTAAALHAAHEAGVLHRDLKPHNVFVSDYGEPALGDFGISSIGDERTITGAGGLSVAYAAPEVLEEADTSSTADVYSLAATLYHLVEGSAPFSSSQIRTTVKRILTEPAPSLTRADAPPSLTAVLRKGLAKRPEDRYGSALEFASALRDVQAEIGIARTRVPRSGEGPTALGVPAVVSPSEDGRRPTEPAAGDTTADTLDVEAPVGRDATSTEPQRAQPAPPGSAPAGLRRTAPDRGEESPQTVERTVQRETIEQAPARRRSSAQGAGVDGGSPLGEEEDEAVVSGRRRWIAVGLGAVAVVAVVGTLFTLTGGSDDSASTTTVITVERPDDDFSPVLDAPGAVVVSVAADGTVRIGFDAVAEAERYEAESVAPSDITGLRAEGETSELDTGVSVDDARCWVVRAIGQGGRISADSPTECAPPDG